jgi:hypothetical protein
MGELSSTLFTTGDADAVRKLDNCATGRPSEVQSHFTQGMSGEAVRKLQLALKNAADNDPDPPGDLTGMPSFTVNGQYDKAFADAIEFYKSARDIKNFAGKIDRIVGIKTIHALDTEATRHKQVDPDPRPAPSPGEHKRALPNCVPEDEVPPGISFNVRMLFFGSGGEGVEISKYWWAIRDLTNGLSAMYKMTGIGLGTPSPIPGGFSYGGGPSKPFSIPPTKVTDFVWCQIGGITHPPPLQDLVNISGIMIQYKAADGSKHTTAPMIVDTGKVNIPGAGFQTGTWSLLTQCHGKDGATRHEIDGNDLVFGKPGGG